MFPEAGLSVAFIVQQHAQPAFSSVELTHPRGSVYPPVQVFLLGLWMVITAGQKCNEELKLVTLSVFFFFFWKGLFR